MLKLKYIISSNLPKSEETFLKENLARDKRAEPEAEWDLIFLEDGKQSLKDFPAKNSLLISEDRKLLKKAGELGMATICYLPSETHEEPDDAPGFSADLYAEGLEEVDFGFLQRVYRRHHRLPWHILATERCIVREFCMDDLDDLFELYAGEGMTDYIEPLYPYEEEIKYQQAYIAHMYGFYGYGMWVVCDKKTGKMLGRAGVEPREELGGELELGYAIGRTYQGRGLAKEVCLAILEYVREELERSCVFCTIDPENRKSRCLAEGLGFVFESKIWNGKKTMMKYRLELEEKND